MERLLAGGLRCAHRHELIALFIPKQSSLALLFLHLIRYVESWENRKVAICSLELMRNFCATELAQGRCSNHCFIAELRFRGGNSSDRHRYH